MKMKKMLKVSLCIISGIFWGYITFFWLLNSIMSAGNLMYERGSYKYQEGESLRFLGFLGCAIYLLVLSGILFSLRKNKKLCMVFLGTMILVGLGIVLIDILRLSI